eukprot:UN26122
MRVMEGGELFMQLGRLTKLLIEHQVLCEQKIKEDLNSRNIDVDSINRKNNIRNRKEYEEKYKHRNQKSFKMMSERDKNILEQTNPDVIPLLKNKKNIPNHRWFR